MNFVPLDVAGRGRVKKRKTQIITNKHISTISINIRTGQINDDESSLPQVIGQHGDSRDELEEEISIR